MSFYNETRLPRWVELEKMSIDQYRNSVVRLTREKATLETNVSQENDKIARLNREIAAITRSITTFTSASMLSQKRRQVESKQKQLAQAQKKAAELQRKIANKLEELNRNVKHLESLETQAQKKRDAEDKKRREAELRHAKEVTAQTQKQAYLHSQLRGSHLVIDLARLPTKIKVLFFAANPQDLLQLRLDEEIRSIEEKIRASEHRDAVELISKWAVRPNDLMQALNEHRPHVVHFSGHGSNTGEIVFQDPSGKTKLVSQAAIVQLMDAMADNIQVVIFNTCFSREQAEAVTQHVDIAIGMNISIGDEAARVFAAQFYSAIGFGRSVQGAFDQAIAALMLEGISEESTPELFSAEGVNPDEIILVRPDYAQ